MIALKKILVATDFGEPAAAALAYGRDLARQYGAALHLMYVEDDLMARYAGDALVLLTPDMQEDIERAALTRLEALLTDADRRELHARATVLSSLSPASVIVEYARAEKIDLIVIGTHGRGAIAHLLMGSVAERVVRLAPCPVLTIRSLEREAVAADAKAAASQVPAR